MRRQLPTTPLFLMKLLSLGLWLCLTSACFSREVQSHGLLFEQWLRETFFGGYRPSSYTQRWDIPAEANPDHGGIPVNPKAIKYGTPIDFGDALRQFEIVEQGERFLLIVGFWEQATPSQKKWVNVRTVEVSPELWSRLWTPIRREDLERLNAVIKNKELSIDAARAEAKRLKNLPPFTDAVMQVNPKIDSSQRRLQCSLRFADFFKHLAAGQDSTKEAAPKVFGIPIPPNVESSARVMKIEKKSGQP